jgi:hypothetical protein
MKNEVSKFDARVADTVAEVLAMAGSIQCHDGVVEKIDLAGTTAFIKSGSKTFLAFHNIGAPLLPGQRVSFRISQRRAIDVKAIGESE